MTKIITVKVKKFEIEDVDIEAYMKEYYIETEKEAIENIRLTAIDAIIAQLHIIGVQGKTMP